MHWYCLVPKLCPTFAPPLTAAWQASLSFTISWSLLKVMLIEMVMTSNYLILSVASFSFFPQSFSASRSFPMSSLFSLWGQSIGALASASVLPMNIQGWFPLGLPGLISLQSKGLLRVFSSTTAWKHQFFGIQSSLWSNSHIHTWLTGKITALSLRMFVGKMTSLLFNILSSLVIDFLPRSKCHLILWLQSPSMVIMELNRIKSVPVSNFPPPICPEVIVPDAMNLDFWMLNLRPASSVSSFHPLQEAV